MHTKHVLAVYAVGIGVYAGTWTAYLTDAITATIAGWIFGAALVVTGLLTATMRNGDDDR